MERLGMVAVAGFASGWMLLWGLAAAIPIVLHYLYRRRQVSISWAAMQLLSQVVEREAKRVHLEQLLLLILRTLVLLVLAIALARPYWESDDAPALEESGLPATTWILAIDVSYSMGYRVDNETRLQNAQHRATEIVEAAHSGDAFVLVALGKPPRAVVASPSFDRQAVMRELQSLAINDAGCDLGGGLQMIADLAEQATQDVAIPSQVRIVVLSDFGSSHWQAAVDGSEAKRWRQLGEKYPIDIDSFADENTANMAVTSLRSDTVRSVVGNPLQINVVVRNYGQTNATQLPVQLSVDGNAVASKRIDLAAQQEQGIEFTFVPTGIGPSVLSVSIPNDRLPVDNTRRLVLDIRNETDVLFVEQQRGDARILSLSLRPESPPPLRRQGSTVSALELASVDLSNWQVVVLQDLSSIDSTTYARLERFVRQGGALICTWGPRANADAWNRRDATSSLLGFRLLDPSAEQIWNIDPLDYRSPVVTPFLGFPEAGLLTTPIFRYWKIAPGDTAAKDWIVDLAIEGGDPLIVRHRVGEGEVTSLLSSPQSGAAIGDNWNAMATWPSFVPLMQRIVQTTLDHSAINHTVLAGQLLVGRKPGGMATTTSSRSSVTVVKPDGVESQLSLEELQPDGFAAWTFAQTQQSGLYLVHETSRGEDQPYGVNVDGSESDLQSISLARLAPSSAPAPFSKIATQTLGSPTEGSPRVVRAWLLVLGLLLISESLLAWSLGRRAG